MHGYVETLSESTVRFSASNMAKKSQVGVRQIIVSHMTDFYHDHNK